MSRIDVATFRELLNTELPRLLREHPESRHEIWGLMLESFPSRQEFAMLHQDLRDFREDTDRRFEGLEGQIEGVRQDLGGQMQEGFQAAQQERQDLESRMQEGFQAARQERQDLEGRIEGVRQDLGGQIAEVRRDLGGQIAEVRQDLGGQIAEVRQDLERRMQEGFQAVRQDLDRLGRRWGIRNESVFRQTIAALLEKSFDARVESRWIDGEEFDVIISDGAHILVEIMASAGPRTQERLERKREMYAEATGVVPARVVLATASIHTRRAQALREAGFEVIEPEEETLE